MTNFLPCPTLERLRAISPLTISPTTVAPLAFALALAAGALAPSMTAAQEDTNAPAGSRSAGTAMRFTKDGPQEIVVTPEQKARREARKAKRKERHAAEKAAAASKAATEPAGNDAADAAGKPTAVPGQGKQGADKVSE